MGLSDLMQDFYSINGSDLIKGFNQMKGIFSKKLQKKRTTNAILVIEDVFNLFAK
jgi:hypothetical protein